jgi:hypothetical protein
VRRVLSHRTISIPVWDCCFDHAIHLNRRLINIGADDAERTLRSRSGQIVHSKMNLLRREVQHDVTQFRYPARGIGNCHIYGNSQECGPGRPGNDPSRIQSHIFFGSMAATTLPASSSSTENPTASHALFTLTLPLRIGLPARVAALIVRFAICPGKYFGRNPLLI